MKKLLDSKLPDECEFSKLSPKLSAQIMTSLAKDPANSAALNTSYRLIPRLRRASDNDWAQENAIHLAMAAFGLRGGEWAEEVTLASGSASGLSSIDTRLYEDNVIHRDATYMPGFESAIPDMTGRAVFEKDKERLIIYTANRLPLEEMLGVDLIYINETKGSVVMVQYKMPERVASQDGKHDWQFRPDKRFEAEVSRMHLPEFKGNVSSYRLNDRPFYFKFVKRQTESGSHQSFVMSLDHLKMVLASPEAKGTKGGIRLSYKALEGTYLRESDMIGLIRSGYIGTHFEVTKGLGPLIDKVAKGNRAVVLAWQQYIEKEAEVAQ